MQFYTNRQFRQVTLAPHCCVTNSFAIQLQFCVARTIMALSQIRSHASRALSRRLFRGIVFALAVVAVASVINRSVLNFGLTSRLAPASRAPQVYLRAKPEHSDAAPQDVEEHFDTFMEWMRTGVRALDWKMRFDSAETILFYYTSAPSCEKLASAELPNRLATGAIVRQKELLVLGSEPFWLKPSRAKGTVLFLTIPWKGHIVHLRRIGRE
eukprot:s153_g54.t1